jgi:nucleoside-diphosphate-sugar epimerase
MTQKIIVTGGSGFIGSIVCKVFSEIENYQVLNFDKSNIDHNFCKKIKGDIRNPIDLKGAFVNHDICIHLAAEHKDNIYPKSLYYDVNVEGSKNICKVSQENNIKKIIFLSSVAVYGFANGICDEDSAINPHGDYGISKFKAEGEFVKWQKIEPESRSLIIIRPTVIFGEGNRGNVYGLMRRIALNKFIMIGSGQNIKSIAYVENIVAFIKFSLENSQPGIYIYNYSDKPDLTIKELVSKIHFYLGFKWEKKIHFPYFLAIIAGNLIDILKYIKILKTQVSLIRIKKFCSNSIYTSKYEDLNFKPPFDIDKALQKTIKFEFK